jgi:hypothetical protein
MALPHFNALYRRGRKAKEKDHGKSASMSYTWLGSLEIERDTLPLPSPALYVYGNS